MLLEGVMEPPNRPGTLLEEPERLSPSELIRSATWWNSK